MAARAYWKGYLRLSLVQCPISLHPATTERQKIAFHQINRRTGHRIRYQKVDAETGEPVDPADVVMGYEIRKGEFIAVTDEELEAVALQSRHTIEIETFVPRREIDDLYKMRPYYVAPDGNAAQEAFAVIRDLIERTDRVAIGRVVLTSREHVIALAARGNILMGLLLRYPYEIADAGEISAHAPHVRIAREMVELGEHIVRIKSGHFDPRKFADRYEEALREIIRKKRKGEPITTKKPPAPSNVISVMDALRRSVEAEGARGRTRRTESTPKRARRTRRPDARSRAAG
jgi:DNA end-binding protein Ku